MLTIQQISSFTQTHQLFSAFENADHQRRQTWIVSDLKTKQDAQNFLIEKVGFCLDDTILRVSEFWKLWILRLDPKIQFVQQEFINSAVQSFLTQKKNELSINDEEIQTSISYLWQMIPFLINQGHQSIVDEWTKQSEKNIQWQKWFLINKLSMSFLLNELKVIHPSWSSFYLTTLPIEKIQWTKSIVFDLGTEISSVEFGIIQVLSQKIDIIVLEPKAEFTQRYPTLLKPYDLYRGYADKTISAPVTTQNQVSSGNQFFRFHNALAEIKWMTQTVRKWIDSGLQPSSIMLCSPQVEVYWPILRMHLEFEGIPFDKPQTIKFKDLKVFQILKSRLDFFDQGSSWSNTESVVLYDQSIGQKIQNRFSHFKKLFYEMTEFEELSLDQNIWSELQTKKIKSDTSMDRQNFLKRVIVEFLSIQFDSESNDRVNSLFVATIKDFLSKTVNSYLSFRMWKDIYFETVEKLDFKAEETESYGVKIRGMNLSFINSVTHKINFGCDQKGLSSKKKSLLPADDLKSLKKDFDFSINESDELNFEFYLRQSLFYQFNEQITTLSHLNLTGDINETPVIILENKLEPDAHFDLNSRIDRLQRFEQGQKSEALQETQSQFLRTESNKVPSFTVSHFSSSSLSNFATCPFIYFMESGLAFRDEESLSIDLGVQQKGLVYHALFEELSRKDFQFTLEDLDTFLESCRKKFQLYLRSDILWSAYKKKMIKVALYFCELEKERGSLHFIRHSEVAFEFKFSYPSENSDEKQSDLSAVIKGRIDRMDIDPQTRKAILYDYKSSHNSISAVKSWIKNNEFQFLIYVMALETDEMKKIFDITTVENTHYYVFKDFKITKGFTDQDQKDHLIKEFEIHLRELLKKIDLKLFPPQPHEKGDCKDCHWKETCRAPHLN